MSSSSSSIDDYDIGQLLGRGGFASVYRARHRQSGLPYAIKIVEKVLLTTQNVEHRVRNEIKIHSKLNHNGIVRFYDYFEDTINIYMILELCEGCNLYRFLKQNGPFNEISASAIMKQILVALQYIHDKGVVHRDLKLSNILIYPIKNKNTILRESLEYSASQVENYQDNLVESNHLNTYVVKLCDFGLAVELLHPDEEHFTLCGTVILINIYSTFSESFFMPRIILMSAYFISISIFIRYPKLYCS